MSGGTAALVRLYEDLYRHHGPQAWWPGESRLEIAVGAILVQRTSWHNAAIALRRLKHEGLLAAEALRDLAESRLQSLLRPAGFYRAKAACLQRLCEWLEVGGGFDRLDLENTHALRQALMSIRGIGPETADVILLYAFERPVFVIDAYTRRILERTGTIPAARRLSYDRLQATVESVLPADASLFNEYHALLVAHGKAYCATDPRCASCPVARACVYPEADSRAG